YPDRVRMVTMGDFSIELCGGTHLSNTGQVGLCRIVSEEPVAKGVRRVVAVTGRRALERVRQTEALVKELAQSLKVPLAEELPRRVAQLQDELKQVRHELAGYTRDSVAGEIDSILKQAETVGSAKIVCHRVATADRDLLRSYADQLREKGGSVALLLAAEIDGKVALLAAVTKDLIAKGAKAGDCVRDAAKAVGGGGGGRPDLAEAGGKDPSQIGAALQAAAEYYRRVLS
ncbi:MAG: alanine--tRNA ligase, partial [Planctomycetaceae bacterium]|nr:alanine--tRNA ligase [Planctomycetaceae bacterium]